MTGFRSPQYSSTLQRFCFDTNPVRKRHRSEGRRHGRYLLRKGLKASIKSYTRSDIGEIVDISKGGFAVKLPFNHFKPARYTIAHVVTPEGLSILYEVPVTKVSYTKVSEDMSFGKELFLRCSFQFDKLTYVQKMQLESLIVYETEDFFYIPQERW